MPLSERLALQRAQLKQNLGLVSQFGGGDDDLIEDEDLIVQSKLEQVKREEEAKKVEAEAEINTEGMSARQRNAAKRRAKKMAKESTTKRSKGGAPSSSSTATTEQKKGRNMKTVVTDQPQSSDKVVLESVVDTEKAYEDSTVWPFQDFCEELCHDLFKYEGITHCH